MELIESTPKVERIFTVTLNEDEMLGLAAVIGAVPHMYDVVTTTEFAKNDDEYADQLMPSEVAVRAVNSLYGAITNTLNIHWRRSKAQITVKVTGKP